MLIRSRKQTGQCEEVLRLYLPCPDFLSLPRSTLVLSAFAWDCLSVTFVSPPGGDRTHKASVCPLGGFRVSFLTHHAFPHPQLCPFPPLRPCICFCKMPQLGVLLEFVVLIHASLWSLVPVCIYTAESSEDQKSWLLLMAEPKHFPQTVPLLADVVLVVVVVVWPCIRA